MYGGYESLADVCVQSAMASVRNMTVDQLRELLNDDAKIDSMIDNLAQVRNLPNDKEAELAQNKSLAEWNLAQEPRIETLKQQLRETYGRATELKSEVDHMKEQLDQCSSDRSLETTSALLQVEAQKADDEAEELARNFEEGAIQADVFMKSFLEKKKLAHIRKVKSERMSGLLRDQLYGSAMNAPRPASSVYPSGPTGTPYPAYPSIPQPNVNRHSFW